MVDKCDRCGTETDLLVDYPGYMLCQNCKKDYPFKETIPKQLQNPDFRFVRIAYKSKVPIKAEEGWRIRGGLKFNDPILLDHISKYKNYGISGGYGNLYLLDSDIPLIGELIEKKFGQTFRVKSGSGRGFHDYFIIKNDTLYRTITFDKDGEHYGELRGDGNYVVCAGSVHPSGGTYEVLRDIPIREINYEELMEYLKDYSSKKQKESKPVNTKPKEDYGDSDIQSISLSDVLGTHEERIANVWHGSTTGKNMVVDYSQGVWHCKRHDAGGGVAKAIALNEGIISSCDDSLSRDDFIEVIKIAIKKYGLKPRPFKPKQQEPKGWAISINIKKFAEKHNFTNCYLCNKPFTFDERLGFYKCDVCGIYGGLKKLATLILKRKQQEATIQ